MKINWQNWIETESGQTASKNDKTPYFKEIPVSTKFKKRGRIYQKTSKFSAKDLETNESCTFSLDDIVFLI